MIVSLRTRLLGGIILGTAVLLAVFSVAVYTVTRQSMVQHFDASLLTTAQMLSALIEEESGSEEAENGHQAEATAEAENPKRQIDFEFDVRMTPAFNHLNGGAYYQVWTGEGKTLSRSPSLGTRNLDRFEPALGSAAYRAVVLPDQTAGRAISYRFLPNEENASEAAPSGDPMLTLVLARSAVEMNDHLAFLRWLLAAASVGVVILSTGIAFLVTRSSLGPIRSLAQTITAVGEDNLGQFFPPEAYPAELSPICRCLNDTLRRLEKSFTRERQFNANVAHELRTPLAGMRSTIEVCLSRDRDSVEYREAFQSCLQIAMTMNKMIDTLLSLSKLESGQIVLQTQSIRLAGGIDTLWRGFADKAYDKGIVFENAVLADAVCRSDKDRLEMILSNVLDNAVEYTNTGGRIRAALERQAGAVNILVSNTGCVLTPEEAQNVFDFFWRKSRSRTEAGTHCGIGLPVARKIAGVLGIAMTVTVAGDVFTVCLHIPDEHT